MTIRNPFTMENKYRMDRLEEEKKQQHLEYLKWMRQCKAAYEEMKKYEIEEEEE